MENVKNPAVPPENAVDSPLREILRNNLFRRNRAIGVKEGRNSGGPLNSTEEYVIIFLILLLFYAIMSRHIKGSNEYL